MSAQCWCYRCSGAAVSRKTFVSHGRRNKPDPPVADHVVPLVSMPERDEDIMADACMYDDSSSGSGSDDDIMAPSLPVGAEEQPSRPMGKGALSTLEVTVLLLDWMCTHKVTDACARDLWRLVSMLLPEGVDMVTFDTVKGILQRVQHKYVQRIEICPNDCIAFWDSRHLPTPYRHAHRTRCPVCDAQRVLIDPADGSRRPAKVVFFFPVKYFMRSLYSRPDLVPFLLADRLCPAPGGVRNSRGWRQKMVENPVMSRDHRNLSLIGTTDGVPFFDDQKRGAWPFVLRCANLDDTLSYHMANCHMHLLSANEFWEVDGDARVLRRRIRGPKSLSPHMHVIVDDLLGAYTRGSSAHILAFFFWIVRIHCCSFSFVTGSFFQLLEFFICR